MATLLELDTIETNANADPGGDPDAVPPVPPDAAIVAARALRSKIRIAVMRRAGVIMVTALPTDSTRSDALDLLSWAQRTIASPDAATASVLRLALVRAPGAASPAAILAATDQAIEDGITPILALLAKGTGQR